MVPGAEIVIAILMFIAGFMAGYNWRELKHSSNLLDLIKDDSLWIRSSDEKNVYTIPVKKPARKSKRKAK